MAETGTELARIEVEGPLAPADRKRFAVCEDTIQHGISTFVEVGRALAEIREGRLYREQYATFEDYCAERWEFTRQRAYQLIGSAQVVQTVSTDVDISPPQNEAQARPL